MCAKGAAEQLAASTAAEAASGRADALVLFGASGDLARKKLFPPSTTSLKRRSYDPPGLVHTVAPGKERGMSLDGIGKQALIGLRTLYEPASWGPKEADTLPAPGGWHNPEGY